MASSRTVPKAVLRWIRAYTLSIVEPPSTGGFQPPVWAVVLVAGIGVALAGLGLMAMRRRTRR